MPDTNRKQSTPSGLAKRRERNPNATEIRGAIAYTLALQAGWSREALDAMTAKELAGLIHIDHDPVPYALARDLGWTEEQVHHPRNLTFRIKAGHQVKTRTKDIPQLAKTKRIHDEAEAFRLRVLAKSGPAAAPVGSRAKPKAKFPSRPMRKAGGKYDWKRGTYTKGTDK